MRLSELSIPPELCSMNCSVIATVMVSCYSHNRAVEQFHSVSRHSSLDSTLLVDNDIYL